ncbi:hypothetical protein KUTeg_006119 [Tegillarca granosa]|uniref:Uncharacterized protein n=1 Tax=Tegillarca granosa TaxID=220873 RepID=A0ABQ9FII5_TEGGR|nr:hypothetical protein KUTeg_006119 [Tegillarca granosa]
MQVKWKMKGGYSLVSLFLIIVISKVSSCPSRCRCEQLYYVYCDNKTISGTDLPMLLQSINRETMFVDLSHNVITHIPSRVFHRHHNLLDLDLGHNQIQKLSSTGFYNLTELLSLDLRGNDISEIENGAFSSFQKLQKLYLQMNKLEKVEHSVFRTLTYLKELHLHGNKLTNISENLFSSLRNLEILDLSHNSILSIQNRALSNLVSLKRLSLANNQISSVTTQTFQGLISLTELNLNKNKIREFQKYHFDSIRSQIKILKLAYNEIKTIDGNLFQSMNNLRILDLSHNQIYAVGDASFSGLQLQELSFKGNQIKEIWKTSFSGAGRIKVLDLSENSIERITSGAFDSFRESLYVLNLRGNSLNNFRYGMVRGMFYLQVLDISRSNIANIDINSFSDLTNLQELNLSDNKLVTLHSGILDKSLAISKLYLHCNPLEDFLGFKFSTNIFVSLNLSILSVTHDSFHVTWPYKDGSQIYWTMSIVCIDSEDCKFTSQPTYLPPYKTDVTVTGLSPLSHYYVCINPSFLSKNIIIKQCLHISTSDITVSITSKPVITAAPSTSSARNLHISHNSLLFSSLLLLLLSCFCC